MKLILICLSLSLIFLSTIHAQSTYQIRGQIVDTAMSKNLMDASVIVLNAKDSIIVSFTRATSGGQFLLSNLRPGSYLLHVSYPGYTDYVESFHADSANKTVSFGKIGLIRRETLLREVLVRGERSAIKIKGDTTIFDARSFVIQPNASVEDLLKQFPGIQIDKNGQITAQGEVVTKVLVDGEEFFGDDPTLVTKNIRADMVDKVQLYDKKSDQAAFTGIDDGKKTKTLNVQLRADKKNGYFGKVDAGIGTNKYYQEQILFNKFQDKQKIAAFGTFANTGKIGLNWQDGRKYGSSNNLQFGDNGDIQISGGGDELETFNGRYNGQGFPNSAAGGGHFADKWSNDKQALNANYKISSLNIDGDVTTVLQQNIPNYLINSNSGQHYHNHVFRQKFDATYDITLDTSSTLKLFIDGSSKDFVNNNNYSSISLDSNGAPINTSNRILNNKGHQNQFDASAFYAKMFKKKGRSLSVTWGESNHKSNSSGLLNADINFYNTRAQIDSATHINQTKKNVFFNNAISTNVTYSEPLSSVVSLLVNYGISLTNSSADRKSFNLSPANSYNLLIDSLSSSYKLNKVANQIGAFLAYSHGKANVNFGTRVYNVAFKQVDLLSQSDLKRTFASFAPQAAFTYQINKLSSLKINYDGHNTLPTLDQIQPLKTNLDPLNIVVGNPNLTPSFNNSVNFTYNSYKMASQQSIYVSGGYGITSNAIVNKVQYDHLTGQAIYQSFNISNEKPVDYRLSVNMRQLVKKIDVKAGINLYAYGATYYSFSNDALNRTKSSHYIIQGTIFKSVENKFDLYLNAGPGYVINQSSLQPKNNNGSSFNADGGLTLYLPWKIQVSSDAQYTYLAKTPTFDEPFHQVLLNASVTRKFFKSQNVQLVVSGNDLLNQNTGFNRVATYNVIQQTQESTIKRYIKFSLIWNFTHEGNSNSHN